MGFRGLARKPIDMHPTEEVCCTISSAIKLEENKLSSAKEFSWRV